MTSKTPCITLTRGDKDQGAVTFTPAAAISPSSLLPVAMCTGGGGSRTIYVELPDGDFSGVFLVRDAIIENHRPLSGMQPQWRLPWTGIWKESTAEDIVALSVGIDLTVWNHIIDQAKAMPELKTLAAPQPHPRLGYAWLEMKAGKPVKFTVRLKAGAPERMTDLQAFLERTQSSVLCDIGFKIRALFKEGKDPELEMAVVDVHVKDFSDLRSSRFIEGVTSVAIDDVVAEGVVKKLVTLGLEAVDGALRLKDQIRSTSVTTETKGRSSDDSFRVRRTSTGSSSSSSSLGGFNVRTAF